MSLSCLPFWKPTGMSLGLALTGTVPIAAAVAPSGLQQAAPPAASPLLKTLLEAEAFSVSANELLRTAATIPAYAKYSVVELMEDIRISYDDAGRATGYYRYIFRVDRESAIQGWGIVQAGWLPWIEDRPVIRARVVTPDGKEHFLDPATIGEAQPSDESQEMFQDRRTLRGPLPKLQIGAVVEVVFQTRDHRAFSRSGIRRSLPLFWNVPVHRSRLLVELPASAPLKWGLEGLPVETLQRDVIGDRIKLRVEQNLTLPLKTKEPLQAWDQEPWPILTLATTPSWAAVVAEYRGILEAQLKGADLKVWVAEAVGDAKGRNQVIDRILARLHQQVRYIGLEFGEAAIVPRTPAETLRRGYGDCKDKSTLLVALLREAGIEAHVALLRVGEGRDFSPELPGLAAFNHAIVYLGGQEPLWIDPSVSQARAGILPLHDYGRRALVIASGTKAPVLIPDVEFERNLQIETREILLAEDGSGRVVETTEGTGAIDVSLRGQFTGVDPNGLKESLKKYIKDTYKSESLERVDLRDPLDLHQPFRLILEAKKVGITYTSNTDARVTMNPWSLVTGLNQNLQPGEKNPEDEKETDPAKGIMSARRTDMLFPHPWASEMRWIIHVPKGYASETLPETRNQKFGPAGLTMAWKSRKDGDVEAIFRFTYSQLRWTPKEVESARAALKIFAEEPSPMLVFQQVGEAHLSAGRLKEALAEFRALASAHPTSAEPLIRLAQAQLQAGLGESARETLHNAIVLEPSSEHAQRQLGWTLEHDALGRRFSPGWDRDGAVSALRKSMELAPDLRAARIDLAILLGHDIRGEWHASNDQEEVVKLYRDQLTRGTDSKPQANLTSCLARMGRFEEARTSAQAMEVSEERNGWIVAMDACTKGSEAAVQEARHAHQDPEVRRKSFHQASNLLMDLRRYPEAGIMAREGVGNSGEAAKLPSRAILCLRLKRYETVQIDTKTPAGAVLAFAKITVARDPSPERVFDLLSPAQRPKRMDAAAAQKAMKYFHFFSLQNGDWRNRRLDESFSVGEFGQEGSDSTGYRLQGNKASPFPSTIFVTCQKGVCRLVAWGNQPSRLGREAMWEVGHGNLEGACAWLDRAIEMVGQPTAQDPLLGHPVAYFWTKGRKGSLEEVRLAAALLVLGVGDETDEASLKILEEALPTVREPAPRAAILRCLLNRPVQGRTLEQGDALSAELLRLYPDQPRAALLRTVFLRDAKRFDEALTLVVSARTAHPESDELTLLEANLHGSQGRMEESAEILKGMIRRGKAQAINLNNLAWADVCRGLVTEQTAEWAEQAVQLRKSPGYLHTQACVLVELGRAAAAREVILEAIAVDDSPRPVDWYVFGRIAEVLGEPAAARACYARVEGPSEDPEDPDAHNTCVFMARRRLALMDGKVASATPSIK